MRPTRSAIHRRQARSPPKGDDLTSEKLGSVAAKVFEELGNMDQTPVQHEMPVETTLEKRGAKATRISTSGGSSVDPAIPRLFVGSCTKYVRPFYVCTVAVTFVFVLSHVACWHHENFVDVITTIGRLPHIKI